MHEAEETYAMYKDMVMRELESKNIDPKALSEMMDLVGSGDLKSSINMAFEYWKENVEKILRKVSTVELPEELDYETYRTNILECIDLLIELKEQREEINDIQHESQKIVKEQIEYFNSDEYAEKCVDLAANIKVEIDALKAKDSRTPEEYDQLKKLEEQYVILTQRYSIGFLFEHREPVAKIADAFFSNKNSQYMMQKYCAKCKQLDMNPALYKEFTGIEEKYLDEKYHVFTNLFLFTIVRYIAYADVHKDAKCISLLFSGLANLKRDTFNSKASKDTFLGAITDYLDKFIEAGLTERFEKENILHPKHPVRLENAKRKDIETRSRLLSTVTKYEFGDIEECNKMSTADLLKFVNEKMIDREESEKAAARMEIGIRLNTAKEENYNEGESDSVTGTTEESSEDSVQLEEEERVGEDDVSKMGEAELNENTSCHEEAELNTEKESAEETPSAE